MADDLLMCLSSSNYLHEFAASEFGKMNDDVSYLVEKLVGNEYIQCGLFVHHRELKYV